MPKERALIYTGALLILMLLVSPFGYADWPMYQHDPAHSGYTADFGPLVADLLWDWDPDVFAMSQGPPVVADGRVYLAVNELESYVYYHAKIICRDAETGVEIWRYYRGSNTDGSTSVAV